MMMHEWPSERIAMESKGNALPIALIVVMIAIYALFGIFILSAIFTAILKTSYAVP